MAETLDAQGRTEAADEALANLAASSDSPESSSAEFVGLFFRLAKRGATELARNYFDLAAIYARRAAGQDVVAAVSRLQRKLWSRQGRSRRKRVVMGCFIQGNTPDGRWGPSWIARGIGGSEQAVVYLSAALQRAGFQVEVYGRPGSEDLGIDSAGVLWAPWWAMPLEPPAAAAQKGVEAEVEAAHAYVAWRDYASVLLMRRAAAMRFVWLHDVYQSDMGAGAEMEAATDGYLLLSREHSKQLPTRLQGKALVTRNGVPDVFFEAPGAVVADELHRRQRFVYASMPSRGLMYVLQAWPTIHTCLARAGLNASLDTMRAVTSFWRLTFIELSVSLLSYRFGEKY